jgi:hypothetical protein
MEVGQTGAVQAGKPGPVHGTTVRRADKQRRPQCSGKLRNVSANR